MTHKRLLKEIARDLDRLKHEGYRATYKSVEFDLKKFADEVHRKAHGVEQASLRRRMEKF